MLHTLGDRQSLHSSFGDFSDEILTNLAAYSFCSCECSAKTMGLESAWKDKTAGLPARWIDDGRVKILFQPSACGCCTAGSSPSPGKTHPYSTKTGILTPAGYYEHQPLSLRGAYLDNILIHATVLHHKIPELTLALMALLNRGMGKMIACSWWLYHVKTCCISWLTTYWLNYAWKIQ